MSVDALNTKIAEELMNKLSANPLLRAKNRIAAVTNDILLAAESQALLKSDVTMADLAVAYDRAYIQASNTRQQIDSDNNSSDSVKTSTGTSTVNNKSEVSKKPKSITLPDASFDKASQDKIKSYLKEKGLSDETIELGLGLTGGTDISKAKQAAEVVKKSLEDTFKVVCGTKLSSEFVDLASTNLSQAAALDTSGTAAAAACEQAGASAWATALDAVITGDLSPDRFNDWLSDAVDSLDPWKAQVAVNPNPCGTSKVTESSELLAFAAGVGTGLGNILNYGVEVAANINTSLTSLCDNADRYIIDTAGNLVCNTYNLALFATRALTPYSCTTASIIGDNGALAPAKWSAVGKSVCQAAGNIQEAILTLEDKVDIIDRGVNSVLRTMYTASNYIDAFAENATDTLLHIVNANPYIASAISALKYTSISLEKYSDFTFSSNKYAKILFGSDTEKKYTSAISTDNSVAVSTVKASKVKARITNGSGQSVKKITATTSATCNRYNLYGLSTTTV